MLSGRVLYVRGVPNSSRQTVRVWITDKKKKKEVLFTMFVDVRFFFFSFFFSTEVRTSIVRTKQPTTRVILFRRQRCDITIVTIVSAQSRDLSLSCDNKSVSLITTMIIHDARWLPSEPSKCTNIWLVVRERCPCAQIEARHRSTMQSMRKLVHTISGNFIEFQEPCIFPRCIS